MVSRKYHGSPIDATRGKARRIALRGKRDARDSQVYFALPIGSWRMISMGILRCLLQIGNAPRCACRDRKIGL